MRGSSGERTQCARRNGGAIDIELAEALGIAFPGVHYEPETVALLSLETAKKTGSQLAMLPFCCSIEAEAMGANIRLGDAANGPRPGDFAFGSAEEYLESGKHLDFGNRRLRTILGACKLLSDGGANVSVEISGPLTILSVLVELGRVFKSWRKNEGTMRRIFAAMRGDLTELACRTAEAGAKLLSFADPVAAPNVLGPKFSRSFADIFLVPFLRELSDRIRGTALHLCPGNARLLAELELAEWHPVTVDGPLSYQEACLAAADCFGFLGEACIKDRAHRVQGGIIKILRLTAPEAA